VCDCCHQVFMTQQANFCLDRLERRYALHKVKLLVVDCKLHRVGFQKLIVTNHSVKASSFLQGFVVKAMIAINIFTEYFAHIKAVASKNTVLNLAIEDVRQAWSDLLHSGQFSYASALTETPKEQSYLLLMHFLADSRFSLFCQNTETWWCQLKSWSIACSWSCPYQGQVSLWNAAFLISA